MADEAVGGGIARRGRLDDRHLIGLDARKLVTSVDIINGLKEYEYSRLGGEFAGGSERTNEL